MINDASAQARSIRAAITAAGEGSRMGRSKALLPFGRSTFLGTMIATLREAGLSEPPAVVVGAAAESVLPLIRSAGALALVNDRYREGRFTSVQLAARWALEGQDAGEDAGACDRLLLWPIDCPAVSPATIGRLLAEARSRAAADVVPSFCGRGGHPVLLSSATLVRVAAAGDGANLRDLLHDAPAAAAAFCAVDDPAVLDNVNTPDDYALFLRERSGAPQGRA